MVSVTASLTSELQDNRLDANLSSATRGVVYARHHDGTPYTLAFGKLQDILLPAARYAVKGPDGQWKLVPWSELQLHTRLAPRKGVLELFAQVNRIAWDDNIGQHFQHKVITQPRYLERGNASTIHNAIDTASPHLSLARLKEVANRSRFLLLHEVPDNVSYNKRHMGYVAQEELPLNIWFYPGGV